MLDGDTFSIDGRRVRLINADAPEPMPGARCPGEAIAAREAVKFAQQVVREGRTLAVEPGGRMDRFGRRLTRVSIDGLDLGDTLHQAGYAARRSDPPFNWCGRVSADGGPPLTSLLPRG